MFVKNTRLHSSESVPYMTCGASSAALFNGAI